MKIKIKGLPTGTDLGKLRSEALARRRVLRQAGLTTFQIGFRGDVLSIICLCCGLGSMNGQDVEKRYCSFCAWFHDDVPE